MYALCIKIYDSTINQNQELYSNGTIYIHKNKKNPEVQLGIQSNSLYIDPGIISFKTTSPTNVCIERSLPPWQFDFIQVMMEEVFLTALSPWNTVLCSEKGSD